MKTQEEILSKILRFSAENGEDPFEYQSDSAPASQVFVSWCYGKGYISKSAFDYYLHKFHEYEFFQLFGSLDEGLNNGGEAIVLSENYGYDYLAEFISSSDFYIGRFNENFEI